MNEFEKSQAEKILSAYGIDINDLEKGRKGEPIGTKKTWGGKEYIKTSKGWTPSKEAKEAHAKIHGTTIDSADKEKIAEGFKNPHGMNISNDPEVRAATADHAKKIIEDLHKKKKEQEFERRKNIPQEQHDKSLNLAKKVIGDADSIEELDKLYKHLVNLPEMIDLPPKKQIEFDDFVDDLEAKLKDKKNAFDFEKVYKGALKQIESVEELDKQYKIVKQKQDYDDLTSDAKKDFDNYVEGLKEKLGSSNKTEDVKPFKDALKDKDTYAEAANTISSMLGTRGEALYNWAKKNNVDLLDGKMGAIASKSSNIRTILDDVINDKFKGTKELLDNYKNNKK